MKTPKEVLTEWAAAYSARDPHTLAALYDEDAEVHHVALGEPVQGCEALWGSFIEFFQAFPDNFTHPENIFEDGEWGIIEWQGGWHVHGTIGRASAHGQELHASRLRLLHITEGRIRFQRGYFDRYTWLSQIGVPFPAKI